MAEPKEPLNLTLAHCLEDLISEMAQCPTCREKMAGEPPEIPRTNFDARLKRARAALSAVKAATLDQTPA